MNHRMHSPPALAQAGMIRSASLVPICVLLLLCMAARCFAGPERERIGMRLVIRVTTVGIGGIEKLLFDAKDDSRPNSRFLRSTLQKYGERYFKTGDLTYLVPHYPAVQIGMWNHHRWVILTSMHPLYKDNPKIVCTAGSLRPVSDADEKRKVEAAQPADYLQFRQDFDAMIHAAEAKAGHRFDYSKAE